MRIITLAAVLVLSFTGAATAQGAPIFNRFEGAWRASGKSFGMAAVTTMRWSPALGGRYWRLDYLIDFEKPDAKDFEGVAYYRPGAAGEHTAIWFDSGGETHAIQAKDDGAALISYWGKPGEKYGRTEYRLTADGGVEVSDFIQAKDRTWKRFNFNSFRRTS